MEAKSTSLIFFFTQRRSNQKLTKKNNLNSVFKTKKMLKILSDQKLTTPSTENWVLFLEQKVPLMKIILINTLKLSLKHKDQMITLKKKFTVSSLK